MKNKLTLQNLLTCFCLILGTIFPLFLTNYYFNIQKSKSLFFMLTVLTGAVLLTALLALRSELSDIAVRLRRPGCLFLGAFLITAFLSAVFSPYKSASFTGSGSRYIGFLFLASGVLCVFMLQFAPVRIRRLTLPVMSISMLISAIAVLMFAGMNPFGLTSSVPENLRGRYLSTIGNSGFFAEYICLMSVLGICLYLRTRERYLLPVLFVLYTALLIGNSSGAVAAFLLTLLLLPLLYRRENDWFRPLLRALLPFPVSALFAGFLFRYGDNAVTAESFIEALCKPLTAVILLVVIGLVFAAAVLSERFPERLRNVFAALKENRAFAVRIYGFVLAGLSAVAVFIFILSAAGAFSEGALAMNDRFAGYRGYIYRRSMKLFGEAPFGRKLFGYGPDSLKLLYREKLGAEMTAATGQVFDSAHNIFLQYLLSTGFIGLFTLCGGIAALLVSAFRKCRKDRLPYLAACCAYLIQALFTADQPMVTPFLFVFLGLVSALPGRDSAEA